MSKQKVYVDMLGKSAGLNVCDWKERSYFFYEMDTRWGNGR